MDNESYCAHLNMIYECANDISLWEPCLIAISNSIKARSGSISKDNLLTTKSSWSIRSNFPPDMLEAYNKNLDTDIWVEWLAKHPQKTFMASHEIIPQKDYLNSDMFHRYGKCADIYYATGLHIRHDNNIGIRIAFQRGKHQGGFKHHTLNYLNRLLPHMERSIALNKRMVELKIDKQFNDDLLNQFSFPIFILDSNHTIQLTNHAAESLLKTTDRVCVHKTKITKIKGIKPNLLSESLSNASMPDALYSENSQLINRFIGKDENNKQSDWVIEIFPCKIPVNSYSHSLFGSVHSNYSVLTIHDTGQGTLSSHRVLLEDFKMSPAEIDVAALIAQGLSPKEIADCRHRSLETIRTQIKTINSKLGASRTSQTIALINKLSTVNA